MIDGLKEEEGNGSNANGSTGSKPNCPLCRSDRDVHWEMSYVPSGCDDDDDLDMLQDSDSNEDEEEEGKTAIAYWCQKSTNGIL